MVLSLWNEFDRLVHKVKEDHDRATSAVGGHDFLHAAMVAQYAVMIAPDVLTGRLAWVASLCHNTDRLFPEMDDERIRRYVMVDYVVECAGWPLEDRDGERIVNAVMEHSKLNSDEDDPVTVTLKDADRLANIGPALIIRAGQYYHDLPCFDPRWVTADDPTANFRNPKTVLRDVREAMVWEDWLRLPKAKELAEPYFEFLWLYVELFDAQVRETGLDVLEIM